MKKIMILGATGMAGHTVYNYLSKTEKYNIITVAYRNLLLPSTIICDVTQQDSLSALINLHQPDVLINCVGVLLKGSKDHPDNAIYINSYLPHLLSRLTAAYGGKTIHLSTDCVYSGTKGGYLEGDFKDADDTYGRSKALGELVNDHDLTIRTSIIGPELKNSGEGLFSWVINQKGTITGYERAFWSGLTTYELAKFIDFAITNNLTGLVHATNNNKISKFDLIALILQYYQLTTITLKGDAAKAIDKSLINTRTDFNYAFPSYEEMIKDQFIHTA